MPRCLEQFSYKKALSEVSRASEFRSTKILAALIERLENFSEYGCRLNWPLNHKNCAASANNNHHNQTSKDNGDHRLPMRTMDPDLVWSLSRVFAIESKAMPFGLLVCLHVIYPPFQLAFLSSPLSICKSNGMHLKLSTDYR